MLKWGQVLLFAIFRREEDIIVIKKGNMAKCKT